MNEYQPPIQNNLGIDKARKSRVDDAFKRFYDGSKNSLAEMFSSERALEGLTQPKTFLANFDYAAILNKIPFSENIFVAVCPLCITKENIQTVKDLIAHGAIVPILTAPYNMYPEDFVLHVDSRDHVNRYEFYAFRHISIRSNHSGGLCGHCAGKYKRRMESALKARSNLGFTNQDAEDIFLNLQPFVNPDFHLMDEFKKSIRSGQSETAYQIINMTSFLYEMRTYEALQAPFILTSSDVLDLPTGISSDLDSLISDAAILEKDVGEGVGLRIPTDVPLPAYLEIASDYRSRMGNVIDKIQGGSDADPIADVRPKLMALNAEIAKLSRSKRMAFLDGAVQFYQANSVYINASLSASAIGLMQGLPGCAIGAVVGGVTTLAKKKNWIASGPATDRAIDIAQSAVSPVTDRLVAAYAGTSTLAVSVVSLRRDISKRVDKAKPKPSTRSKAKRIVSDRKDNAKA